MGNRRLPKLDDKVKIINCKAAIRFNEKICTVKGRIIKNKKLVFKLNELEGDFEAKHLLIVTG